MKFEFKTEPFSHQAEAFERFKDASVYALLADMGTGKSKIAVDTTGYKFAHGITDRVLIVAPSTVHPQWIDEQFPIHCSVPWEGLSYSRSKRNEYLKAQDKFFMECKYGVGESLRVLTINFESFSRETGIEIASRFLKSSRSRPTIIIDEASRIKTPDAKMTKALLKLRSLFPQSFRIIITGTPAAKAPANLWTLYEFLKPRYMGCSYIAFKREHTVMLQKRIHTRNRVIRTEAALKEHEFIQIKRAIDALGPDADSYQRARVMEHYGLSQSDFWFICNSTEVQTHKKLDELKKKIAPVTFSASKADCLDLPEKIYEKVLLSPNKNQKKLIRELEKYSLAMYDGEELTLELRATLGLRVLQICGGFFSHHTDIEGLYEQLPIKGRNKKLEYIKEDIPEIGSQQFIVWAVFTEEVKLLYKELSELTTMGLVAGAGDNASRAERAQAVADFKAGKIQGLVSNPSVGGYGLNFENATVQYWYSRNYRTEDRLQAEDRSHRATSTRSPVYKDLIVDIPWEHKVLESNLVGKSLNSNFVSTDLNELFAL